MPAPRDAELSPGRGIVRCGPTAGPWWKRSLQNCHLVSRLTRSNGLASTPRTTAVKVKDLRVAISHHHSHNRGQCGDAASPRSQAGNSQRHMETSVHFAAVLIPVSLPRLSFASELLRSCGLTTVRAFNAAGVLAVPHRGRYRTGR